MEYPAFIDASLKGWNYAVSYPQKAIQITHQHYATDKDREHLEFEARETLKLILPQVIDIGHMSSSRWENIQQQLMKIGLMQKRVDLQEFLFDAEQNGTIRKFMFDNRYPLAILFVLLLVIAGALIQKYANMRQLISVSVQREKKAFYLATQDPLTQIPNRLLLEDRLTKALSRTRRAGNYLCIAFIDLDNFKQVNDSEGHDKGDALLIHISQLLNSILRTEDTVARYGGDEFVALFEERSRERAIMVGNRLFQNLSSSLAGYPGRIFVSCSIGMLLVNKSSTRSASELISKADELMYQVKNASKNSIIFGELGDDDVSVFHVDG